MKVLRTLYFWIFSAFVVGTLLGLFAPHVGLALEPIGVVFIKLVKCCIAPILFLTITLGIAQTGSFQRFGKIGVKSLIYFEIVSTFALAIGWLAATLLKPGTFVQVDPALLNTQALEHTLQQAQSVTLSHFIQHIFPSNIIEPFTGNNILQIIFLAMLCGLGLLGMENATSYPIVTGLQCLNRLMFRIINLIMLLAPLAVLATMAHAIAKFGSALLLPLLALIGTFYLTSLCFILIVLGAIARMSGFSILKFIRYLAPEIVLVLGTCTSEAALPQLIDKLEKWGCQRKTVSVVVPLGYSFNLDGTNIYITLAALFIAQALNIELTFLQQLTLFATAMLTSKGTAGVAGAGFVTLAATLAVVPAIPMVGLVLILGIDRFMSEARTLVNYLGNGVAGLAISRWENELPR